MQLSRMQALGGQLTIKLHMTTVKRPSRSRGSLLLDGRVCLAAAA